MSINPHLLSQARGQVKQAFVAAGDPSMGGDPAAAGGAPPMDPAMAGGDPAMAGGDPAAMGGAPPMDPMAQIQPMIDQAVQAAMAAGGGAAGGGAGPAIKPKIDVNVELMQIKKLLARIADAMGVQIPAAEMVATPEDLGQMAEGGTGAPAAADGGAAGGGGALGSIEPIKAAEDWESGVAFTPPAEYDFQNTHETVSNNASLATALLMRNRSN